MGKLGPPSHYSGTNAAWDDPAWDGYPPPDSAWDDSAWDGYSPPDYPWDDSVADRHMASSERAAA